MELRARGSRFALPPCGTANPFCVSITLGQRLGEARIAAPERGQTAMTDVGVEARRVVVWCRRDVVRQASGEERILLSPFCFLLAVPGEEPAQRKLMAGRNPSPVALMIPVDLARELDGWLIAYAAKTEDFYRRAAMYRHSARRSASYSCRGTGGPRTA